MQKIWYSFRFLIVLAGAFAIARCNEKTETKATTTTADNTIAVRVQPVTDTSYTPALKYSGSMASATEAKLSFKTGGIIAKMYVKEGDHVTKGQLLAVLDLTEINAQVTQAQQNSEKAQRDVKRVTNLYNDTVATLEQLQNVTTQQKVSEEGLRIARFNHQYAQIHATETGTILKKNMNEGEYAAAGSPVFFFSGTAGNDWVVRFGVADKDWAILKRGDKAAISLDAYPQKTFTGIISEIAEGADVANGTYEVEVKILPNGARFASGLFAAIQLQPAAQQRVILIPIEALAEADGKSGYVYTVNDDQKTVSRHAVKIAFLEKYKAAIVSGLDGVKEVITDGVGYLTEKATVKVIK
jgi:multidrug efflux system membrane fusion protein